MCGQVRDAFITGSDQVWNLTWYVPAYFLDFVPSEKTKISYAASIGMKSLDDEQKQIFKNSLKDYQAVSVREEASTEMLKEISPHTPQYVLDPTLLLSAQEWDEISAERVIEEKYVFCYFLGDDRRERKIAEKYARKRGLKIVTFPHIANKVVRSDFHFGDIRMFDATPEQFISLIKHAEYVFTDSFHATVFSNIYHKEYFVFERAGRKGMGSRIYSLTGLFESEERFCDTAKKARLKYIENLPKLDYSREFPHFEEMKEKSMDYLKRNLQAAAERLSESEE